MSDDLTNSGAEPAGSPGSPSADAWLDARLRNVPLPVGLLRRLEQVADPEMARLESALVDVALPEGFLDRLRDIARVEPAPRRRFAPERLVWARWAVAASLLLGLGAIVWTTFGDRFFGTQDVDPRAGAIAGAATTTPKGVDPSRDRSDSGHQRAAEAAAPQRFVQSDDRDDVDSERASGLAMELDAGDDFMPVDPDAGDLAAGDSTAGDSTAGNATAGDATVTESPEIDALVDHEASRAAGLDAKRTDDPLRVVLAPSPAPGLPKTSRGGAAPARSVIGPEATTRDTLGSQGMFQDLPDLDAVQIQVAHGVTPPIIAQYDLRFLLRYGQHPFVSPGASPALRSVQLPLVGSTGAWRRLSRLVAEGRLPAPQDVRTEDFLAALDYHFAPPAPRASLAIASAAAPSPFGDAALSLLQVAIHAGQIADDPRAGTHLTLVLDASRSLRRSEQWSAIEQSLDRLVERMQPADRLTVIAYSAEAQVVADSLNQDQLLRDGSGRLAKAIAATEARPAANIAAALETACWSAAQAKAAKSNDGPETARRLLIISGGRDDSGAQLARRVQARLAEVAATGLAVNLVDLGQGDRAAGSLDAWAKAGRGRVARAADVNSLSWRLVESLVGYDPIVAERAKLKITFNPEVVESYRLLGHERTSLTGPVDPQTEVDLRCDELATALFELVLKPGRKDEVATIEAQWRRPNHGREQSVKQRITRNQFAATFVAAPASLQTASVAAYAAEALRGSYFSLPNRSLARVADLAKQVAKLSPDEPSFREMEQFIRQAERLRSRRAAKVNANNLEPGGSSARNAAVDGAPPGGASVGAAVRDASGATGGAAVGADRPAANAPAATAPK